MARKSPAGFFAPEGPRPNYSTVGESQSSDTDTHESDREPDEGATEPVRSAERTRVTTAQDTFRRALVKYTGDVAVELVPGARIAGKLRLVRPLGQGGMGVVWAAHHEALDKEVAVKLIRPERVAANPELMARFEREAKTTARISHPHVVHVMDYGTVDDAVPYIVMELLNGFSLAELIESGGRLSLSTARVLVQQVGSALESAHERGVVHRDIKPHNVFILEESQGYPLFVKVLDFGIAKMLGDAQVPGGSALTETGTIVGSPPYMSPEQIEGSRHVDLRSDLWSLGVITYEALTGKTPFRGNSFVAVGAAVLEGRYEPATRRRPGLPRRIDDWFAKALSVDPEGRFQNAEEMIAAFQKVGEEEELPSISFPPASRAPRAMHRWPKRSRRLGSVVGLGSPWPGSPCWSVGLARLPSRRVAVPLVAHRV
jgi:serine/threonine protein kinase